MAFLVLHRSSDEMGVICEHLHFPKQGNVNVKSIHPNALRMFNVYSYVRRKI